MQKTKYRDLNSTQTYKIIVEISSEIHILKFSGLKIIIYTSLS